MTRDVPAPDDRESARRGDEPSADQPGPGGPIEIIPYLARSILTSQDSGYLCAGPFPITHTLSPYIGCTLGLTTCGMFCYARRLPGWALRSGGVPWGRRVLVKTNAPTLLETELAGMSRARRRAMRVFFSSTHDPYQPLVEPIWRLTRRCLRVFARYADLDLVVLQTRSPLVAQDLDLLREVEYLWLSVSVETDDDGLFRSLRGGPSPTDRLALVGQASRVGIKTQVAVSPCLPYSPDFAARLLDSGASRFIVDTFVAGDGSGGRRTARSPYATARPDWADAAPAEALYEQLRAAGATVGWSEAGFCGIPPRVGR